MESFLVDDVSVANLGPYPLFVHLYRLIVKLLLQELILAFLLSVKECHYELILCYLDQLLVGGLTSKELLMLFAFVVPVLSNPINSSVISQMIDIQLLVDLIYGRLLSFFLQ